MITARQASPFGPLGRAASEITGHREKNWAVKKNSEVWRKTESDKCINYQNLPKCLLSLFFVQMYTEKNSRTQGCKGNRKWQFKNQNIFTYLRYLLFSFLFRHLCTFDPFARHLFWWMRNMGWKVRILWPICHSLGAKRSNTWLF